MCSVSAMMRNTTTIAITTKTSSSLSQPPIIRRIDILVYRNFFDDNLRLSKYIY